MRCIPAAAKSCHRKTPAQKREQQLQDSAEFWFMVFVCAQITQAVAKRNRSPSTRQPMSGLP
jgi:hypothetical protein